MLNHPKQTFSGLWTSNVSKKEAAELVSRKLQQQLLYEREGQCIAATLSVVSN